MERLRADAKAAMHQQARARLLEGCEIPGPVSLACEPRTGGGAVRCALSIRSTSSRLADNVAVATMAQVEQSEAKAMAEALEDAAACKRLEMHKRLEVARERLRAEVFEDCESDVVAEFVGRLAEVTGRVLPSPRPNRISLSSASRHADTPVDGVGVINGSFICSFTTDDGATIGASVRASARASSRATVSNASLRQESGGDGGGRQRARTLAGHWASGEEDGEALECEIFVELAPPSTTPACAASPLLPPRLGVKVEDWNGECVVLRVEAGGAAEREGTLRVGDVILSVDGAACTTAEDVERLVSRGGWKSGRVGKQQQVRTVGTTPSAMQALSSVGPTVGNDEQPSVYRPPSPSKELGIEHVFGRWYTLGVLRRCDRPNLRSRVLVRMPSGACETFTMAVRSTRTITYEQHSSPHARGAWRAYLLTPLRFLWPGFYTCM